MSGELNDVGIARLYNKVRRDYPRHLPSVKRIVNHFSNHGFRLTGRGSAETPSLSFKQAGGGPTLFIIGTKSIDNRKDCFVEIYYSGFKSLYQHRGNDTEVLTNFRKSLDKVVRLDWNKSRPGFYFDEFLEENSVEKFISAFDLLSDYRPQTGKGNNSIADRKPLAYRLAMAWDILVSQAENPDIQSAQITYKKFRNRVLERGAHNQLSGTGTNRYLHPIQNLCQLEGLPALTGLVVSKQTRRPKAGYVGTGHLPYEIEMAQVLGFKWATIPNPWRIGDSDSVEYLQAEQIAKEVLSSPEKRYRFGKIPVRLQQSVFREMLLMAYEGKCAVCGIDDHRLLDAAHIKPWSCCELDEMGDVRNGMLLCKNHHASFDAHLWTIGDNLKIITRADFSETKFGKRTSVLTLPRNTKHRPSAIYLFHHRKAMERKS